MGISRPPFGMAPFGTDRDGKFGLLRPHRQVGPQKGYRAYRSLSNQTEHRSQAIKSPDWNWLATGPHRSFRRNP